MSRCIQERTRPAREAGTGAPGQLVGLTAYSRIRFHRYSAPGFDTGLRDGARAGPRMQSFDLGALDS